MLLQGTPTGDTAAAEDPDQHTAAAAAAAGPESAAESDSEEEPLQLQAGAEPEFSLAGLIRRMGRAAGDRRHAGQGRRLVALRFIAGAHLSVSCAGPCTAIDGA